MILQRLEDYIFILARKMSQIRRHIFVLLEGVDQAYKLVTERSKFGLTDANSKLVADS